LPGDQASVYAERYEAADRYEAFLDHVDPTTYYYYSTRRKNQ